MTARILCAFLGLLLTASGLSAQDNASVIVQGPRSIPVQENGTLAFVVENSSRETWPPGDYTIETTVTSAPSGSDSDAFVLVVDVPNGDLEPGRERRVERTVTAPNTTGSYRVNAVLLFEGDQIAQKNFVVTVSDRGEGDYRMNLRGTVRPNRVLPGEEFSVRVTCGNNGISLPQETHAVDLYVTRSPSGAVRAQTDAINARETFNPARGDDCPSFEREYTAPMKPGSYTLQLEILRGREVADYRGAEETLTLTVSEPEYEMAITRINPPRRPQAGRNARLAVRFRNSGDLMAPDGAWGATCTVEPPRSSRARAFEIEFEGDRDLDPRETRELTESFRTPEAIGEWTIECEPWVNAPDRPETGRTQDAEMEVVE